MHFVQVQTCLGVFLLWELKPKLDSHTRNSCILNKVLVLRYLLCKKCRSYWGLVSLVSLVVSVQGKALL